MVKVHMKYVNAIETKGVVRYYFRRFKKAIRLPDDPQSAEFLTAYNQILLDTMPDRLPKKVTPGNGTMAALVELYYKSPQFKVKSQGTKRVYRLALDKFCKEHGGRRVDQLKRANVMRILGGMEDHPGAANLLSSVLSMLMTFAVKADMIPTNPLVGMEQYRLGTRHTWTDGEIAKYEAKWPLGTRERLCFDVLLYTGQRVSDASKLPKPDSVGKIRLVQQKTGTRLTLSCHPSLQRSIDACPNDHLTILTTARGRPLSGASLSKLVQRAAKDAGLPTHCLPHGLRKSAARRLVEAGATPHEVMSVTGHTTLAEVERYTRDYSQEMMNESALRKQTGNAKVTNP